MNQDPEASRGGHIDRVRVIGVIDLMAGLAVHARGGRRDAYEPVRSRLLSPAQAGDAAALARAYRERAKVAEIYVADLDAISGAASVPQSLAGILSAGLPVMADAGAATVTAAQQMRDLGAARVVVGLETLASFGELASIVRAIGEGAVVFSLDLRDGRPITRPGAPFSQDSALMLARRAAAAGVRCIVVLDLGRVGRATGPGMAVLRCIRDALPETELLAGGGVRDAADLADLAQLGVAGVLVGTALHEGVDLSGAGLDGGSRARAPGGP
jgi:phosphoribosylformimino-5-aminoimidazole carboxamide ribotide isomerase